MEITWKVIESTNNIGACSNKGESDTETSIGIINSENKFIRFRIYEAYYNQSIKGIGAKVISENILPYSE